MVCHFFLDTAFNPGGAADYRGVGKRFLRTLVHLQCYGLNSVKSVSAEVGDIKISRHLGRLVQYNDMIYLPGKFQAPKKEELEIPSTRSAADAVMVIRLDF